MKPAAVLCIDYRPSRNNVQWYVEIAPWAHADFPITIALLMLPCCRAVLTCGWLFPEQILLKATNRSLGLTSPHS